MRSYFMVLVDTCIFLYKSSTYVNVIYIRYFINLEMIHEYKWRENCWVYLSSKLDEGIQWKTSTLSYLYSIYGTFLHPYWY